MNEYEVNLIVTVVVEAENESEAVDEALLEVGPVGEEIRVESAEKI